MIPNQTAAELSPTRRALILVAVVMATTLYGTTLLIVSTILPQMQGSFSATADEIAWAMTFNILATAIITPMTGWLVARFGTRRTMVTSVAGFTFATLKPLHDPPLCEAERDSDFAAAPDTLAHYGY